MSDLTTPTMDAALSEACEWVAAANCDQAIARCNELLSSYPDAVRALRTRARAYELSGDTGRAIEDNTRVLEIVPASYRDMVGLARCQLTAGHPEEATTLARRALDFAPQDPDALQIVGKLPDGAAPKGPIAVARSWFDGGLANRAVAEVRRMTTAAPNRIDLQIILAEMLWRSGMKITTAELCQAILDAQPDCLNAHVILSALWTQIGNSGIAEVHGRAAQRLDPDARETHDWLGGAAPFPVSDVPAHVQPQPQVDPDAGEREDPDEERDRAAWVDELIAAGPVSPVASAVPPAPETPPAPDQAPLPPSALVTVISDIGADASDAYSGAVEGISPLEWTPVSPDDDEDVPGWLAALQSESSETNPGDVQPAETGAAGHATSPESAGATSKDLPGVPINVPLEWEPAATDELLQTVHEPAAPVAARDQPATSDPAPTSTASSSRASTDPDAPAVTGPATPGGDATALVVSVVDKAAKPERRKRVHKSDPQKSKPTSDDLLALARKAVEEANYDEAANHYTSLISSGKKLDLALADLQSVIAAHPELRRFHALLGDCYTRKGDVNAALMAYHRALESN